MKTILLAAGILVGWLNASLAQGAGTKIWDYSVVPAGHSIDTPALGPDGTIYVNGVGSLYALDANGHLKAHIASNGGVPITAGDGTVYRAQGATLYAYDATLTNSVTNVFTVSANIISGIVLGPDGTFYFGTYSLSDGTKLQAVSSTGTLKWQYPTVEGAPDMISLSPDETIYFSFVSGSKLYAVTPSGTKKWAFPAAPQYGYAAIARDGTVYVDYGKVYALAPESTNPNGTKKWEFDAGSGRFAPVVGADGTIYVAGSNSVLYALNPNGTKRWEFQMGRPSGSSAAIGHDGTIYVGSQDHFLYAINPDGSYKWSFETGGEITESPSIAADGTVYIGSQDGKLYAIKGDAVSDTSPWPMFGRDLRHSGRVTCPKGTPCFDTERMMTNGAFDMVLIGKAGATYGFDVSTNLTDWFRLTNRVSANGAIRLVDDTATNYPCRFYRGTPP